MTRPPSATRAERLQPLLLSTLRALSFALLLILCCQPPLTAAFFQWCHSAQNVAGDPYWSVVTSGALVTNTFSATDGSSQTLQVVSITGTRTQRNATTTVVSFITELASVNSTGNQNTNDVNTHWPQLSNFPGGIGYRIEPPVQLPLDSSGPAVSVIGLYNQPPVEWGVNPLSTAVSYFIFEAGNTGVALNCPLPAAISYSFHYITIPVNVYHPIFSACMTGSMQLIGPFAMANDLTLQISPTYIMQNATGYRLFTNNTGSNGGAAYQQTIINVGTDDGGDFVFYTAYPWFDDAGLTFELTSASVVQDGMQAGGAKWVNLWRENSYPNEAANINPGNPDNYIDWHYALAEGDGGDSFQCPTTVSFPIFNFCHYAESLESDAEGSVWTVVESGVLWTATMNADGQYYAAAIGGRRLYWSGAVLQVNTSIAQIFQLNASYPSAVLQSNPTDPTQQPLGGDASSYEQVPFYNDNLLGTSFPYLSTRGLLYQTLDYVPLPGTDIMTQFIGWKSTPPVEAVNVSTAAVGTGFSFFAYQEAALGSMSCDKRTAPRQSFDFYFSATPTAGANETEAALYGDWSVCLSGSLTAIGPYYLPSASSASNTSTAFFAVAASGLRVFIDQYGAATTNSIMAVSNAGGADFALYLDGPSGALDAGGLSFSFDSLPRFATGLSSTAWTRLYSQDGEVSEAAAGYVAVNSGLFSFSPSAQSALPVCMQPGQSLSFSQTATDDGSSGSSGPGAGYLVLAALLSLIGCLTALLSVEHTVHNLRNRSDARWLFWLVATAVSMGVCGVWASMLAQYASLSVPCEACVDGIELSYSTSVVLLGLLPAVLPLALGLALLTLSWSPSGVGRVGVTQVGTGSLLNTTQNTASMLSKSAQEDTVLGGGEAGAAEKPQRRSRARSRLGQFLHRVKADLTLLQLLVAANFSMKTVVAAALLALSLVLCRVTLLFSLTGNVTFTASIAASILSSLLVWLLVTPALSIYFFGVRYRWLAVLLVTAATVIDYQIHVHTVTIAYAPSHHAELSSEQLYSSLMTASDLVLVGGVIGAVCLAALLALQFSRLRFKAKRLAQAVASTKNKLTSAQHEVMALVYKQQRTMAMCSELMRTLDAIHTLRPGAAQSTQAMAQLVWAFTQPASMRSCPLVLSAAETTAVTRRESMAADAAGSSNSSSWAVSSGRESALVASEELRALAARKKELPVRSLREQEEFMLEQYEAVSSASKAARSGSTADGPLLSPTGQEPAADSLPLSASGFLPTLSQVLSHPLTLELLKDHMEAAHCTENVLFLLSVNKWAVVKNKKLRRTLALALHHQFIVEGADMQVNINAALRSSIGSRLSRSKRDVSPDLFTAAYREIVMLIETNNWKSFVASPAYGLAAAVLLRNAVLMQSLNAAMDDDSGPERSSVLSGGHTESTVGPDDAEGSVGSSNSLSIPGSVGPHAGDKDAAAAAVASTAGGPRESPGRNGMLPLQEQHEGEPNEADAALTAAEREAGGGSTPVERVRHGELEDERL